MSYLLALAAEAERNAELFPFARDEFLIRAHRLRRMAREMEMAR